MGDGPDKRYYAQRERGRGLDNLLQAGLYPGLHAQVPPLEAGEMEQAGPLRWPARVHTQLHRER